MGKQRNAMYSAMVPNMCGVLNLVQVPTNPHYIVKNSMASPLRFCGELSFANGKGKQSAWRHTTTSCFLLWRQLTSKQPMYIEATKSAARKVFVCCWSFTCISGMVRPAVAKFCHCCCCSARNGSTSAYIPSGLRPGWAWYLSKSPSIVFRRSAICDEAFKAWNTCDRIDLSESKLVS